MSSWITSDRGSICVAQKRRLFGWQIHLAAKGLGQRLVDSVTSSTDCICQLRSIVVTTRRLTDEAKVAVGYYAVCFRIGGIKACS
jgi:hypothetical protein